MKMTMRPVIHGSREYEETVALRYDVLRRPLGIGFTPEQLGKEISDFHLACYCNGTLAGCMVLTPGNGTEIRMRQVAVAEGIQRQGAGSALVKYSERLARGMGCAEMILHARES